MDFWWENDDELSYVYDNATYGLTQEELDPFGLTEDDMRYMFDVGWVAGNVDPDEREQARDEFFEYLTELGYDVSDFDWDAWRDWYDAA